MGQSKLIILSLLVFLLTGPPTSSFNLTEFLTKQIATHKHSKAQLDFALKRSNETALRYAWQQTKKHSVSWQYLAKQLAKTQGVAAYQLALFYQTQNLALQAIVWHQRAIRLEFPPAFVALAQYYYEQNKLVKSERLLAKLPQRHSEETAIAAQVLSINLAINRGDIDFVKDSVAEFSLSLQKAIQGRLLLDKIDKYQVLSANKYSDLAPVCANSLQFFATNFAHLQRLEKLIEGFEQQELSQSICFSPVRYIAIDALSCSENSAQAIQCNEQHWQLVAESIKTRFVGVLLPEGGANVHLGVLYIDAQDSLDVLSHEVSHLLGFVDEYPLAKNHQTCESAQSQVFSENIAVLNKYYQGRRSEVRAKVLTGLAWAKHIKASTPILQPLQKEGPPSQQQWQLGTPTHFANEIGVFNAQTCVNQVDDEKSIEHTVIAFKPLATPTKMQYFSLDFPREYLSFLQQGAFRYLMPSFHYNIALAHFQKGNLKQANYWLKQSAMWESEQSRRKKILQGDF